MWSYDRQVKQPDRRAERKEEVRKSYEDLVSKSEGKRAFVGHRREDNDAKNPKGTAYASTLWTCLRQDQCLWGEEV
jgi:hypothetical protein